MKQFLIAALTAFAVLAAPAGAGEMDRMTADERAAFRAEVRAYLLENPEVIMEAVAVLEARRAEAQAATDMALIGENAQALFNDGQSWVGGNPDGDITLVEFMDYRCSYCRRAFDEVVELVESDGNIRFVIKELPVLGEQSVAASRFAIATQRVAGDAAYKAIHAALMSYDGDMSEVGFSRLARSMGLDAQPILDQMNDPEVSALIDANFKLAQKMGISGTPSFVMGGQLLRGYMPLEQMRAAVDKERAGG